MNHNIYENLKKVLNIGLIDKKLDYYQAMSGTSLDDALKYKDMEEGLVSYLSTLESISNSLYSKSSISKIKMQLGIQTIYDEKVFFTRVFMRDYQSRYDDKYKFRSEVDIRNVFNHFASDELKNDIDFSKTIIKLDGKYLLGMSEELRSNKEIVSIAIKNDTSKDVDSFICSLGDALKSSDLALQYLQKRKENNDYFSVSGIYEEIFKKDENDNFIDTIFKNNIQNEWLKDNNFIIDLVKMNGDFLSYVVDGKISISKNDSSTVLKYK